MTSKSNQTKICPYCQDAEDPADGCALLGPTAAAALTQQARSANMEVEPVIRWADRLLVEASLLGCALRGELVIAGFDEDGYKFQQPKTEQIQ